MEQIIENLDAAIELMQKEKQRTPHLDIAQAQMESAAERLKLHVKESSPAAPEAKTK